MKISVLKAKLILKCQVAKSIKELFIGLNGEVSSVWINNSLNELVALGLIKKIKNQSDARSRLFVTSNILYIDWANKVLIAEKTLNFDIKVT